ncbi:MAG: PKD domain-containing protein [Actinobacteria bacterium]|nr:MAG: PKD domain-containing protein [Actinomycetota bacterium]
MDTDVPVRASLCERAGPRRLVGRSAVLAATIAVFAPAQGWAAPHRVAPGVPIHAQIARGGAATTSPTEGAVGRSGIVARRGAPSALYAQQKRAAAARAASGPRAASSPQTPHAAVVFDGLNTPGLAASDVAPSNRLTPPDTTGAIGLNHYVEVVNHEIAVYNRATLVSPALRELNVFTASSAASTGVCDPNVKYDPQADRWFYVVLRCDGSPTNELYVGFSKTGDPSDLVNGWCRYTVPSPNNEFDDYPKLGLDASHITIGANAFDPSGNVFLTARILVASKPTSPISDCASVAPTFSSFPSLANTPLTSTATQHTISTPEPATVADASSGGFIVAADQATAFSGTGSKIVVFQVTGGAPAGLSEAGAVSVMPYTLPPSVPQPSPANPIDTIDTSDTRLIAAVAARDPNAAAGGAQAVWASHAVASGAGSAVQWYEIVPGPPLSLRQQGQVTDLAGFAFNGAIAPMANGGAAVDYDAGGSAQRVQVKAQSRSPTTPVNTMDSAITLVTSPGVDADFSCPSQTSPPSTSCRWGDYSGASVDPSHVDVVWGSNQFNGLSSTGNATWATQNFALSTDAPPSADFTAAPNPVSPNTPVSFTGTASDPDGTIASYSWNFGDGSAPATGQTVTHAYANPGNYTVTLTVTDNGGQTGTANHVVTVTAPAPAPAPASGSTPTAAPASTPSASAAPTPLPSPPASPARAAALAASATVLSAHLRGRNAVLRRGLLIRLSATTSARASFVVLMPTSATRALRLSGPTTASLAAHNKHNKRRARFTIIGRGTFTIAAGTRVLRIKLNRRAARKLARAKAVKLTIRLTLTDGAGRSVRLSRTVRLRR